MCDAETSIGASYDARIGCGGFRLCPLRSRLCNASPASLIEGTDVVGTASGVLALPSGPWRPFRTLSTLSTMTASMPSFRCSCEIVSNLLTNKGWSYAYHDVDRVIIQGSITNANKTALLDDFHQSRTHYQRHGGAYNSK